MKIQNTTTGAIADIRHPFYQIDGMADLCAGDDGIKWNPETEIHEATQETLDWWTTYLEADAAYLEARDELRDEVREDLLEQLDEELAAAMNCDMEDQPKAGMAVIEEWREHGGLLRK